MACICIQDGPHTAELNLSASKFQGLDLDTNHCFYQHVDFPMLPFAYDQKTPPPPLLHHRNQSLTGVGTSFEDMIFLIFQGQKLGSEAKMIGTK